MHEDFGFGCLDIVVVTLLLGRSKILARNGSIRAFKIRQRLWSFFRMLTFTGLWQCHPRVKHPTGGVGERVALTSAMFRC